MLRYVRHQNSRRGCEEDALLREGKKLEEDRPAHAPRQLLTRSCEQRVSQLSTAQPQVLDHIDRIK
jgi:hypothetical protein